jgi:hypothetical protein
MRIQLSKKNENKKDMKRLGFDNKISNVLVDGQVFG